MLFSRILSRTPARPPSTAFSAAASSRARNFFLRKKLTYYGEVDENTAKAVALGGRAAGWGGARFIVFIRLLFRFWVPRTFILARILCFCFVVESWAEKCATPSKRGWKIFFIKKRRDPVTFGRFRIAYCFVFPAYSPPPLHLAHLPPN